MPDSAFLDTENQFRAAALGANGAGIEFELYTIKEIPRSDKVAALIEERYRGLDELWTCPPDALIVTGTEPTQVQMRFEPYWPYLARLLEWAADNRPDHAAVVPVVAREHPPVRRHRPSSAAGQVQRRVRRRSRGPVQSAGERASRHRSDPSLASQRGARVGARRCRLPHRDRNAAPRAPAGRWRRDSVEMGCSSSARAIRSTAR